VSDNVLDLFNSSEVAETSFFYEMLTSTPAQPPQFDATFRSSESLAEMTPMQDFMAENSNLEEEEGRKFEGRTLDELDRVLLEEMDGFYEYRRDSIEEERDDSEERNQLRGRIFTREEAANEAEGGDRVEERQESVEEIGEQVEDLGEAVEDDRNEPEVRDQVEESGERVEEDMNEGKMSGARGEEYSNETEEINRLEGGEERIEEKRNVASEMNQVRHEKSPTR